MKVMYGNHVNVLMMANMLHVRFVGRNCPVEAVQHLRSGNICLRLLHPSASNAQIQILTLYSNKRLCKRH